jgi:NADH-quinone oxidoreductase subunit A
MDFTLTTYYPVFIYLAAVIAVAGGAMAAAHFTPKAHRKTDVKLMPYESGMDPIGDARRRFDVKFYLIAIVFLVFDVELLFLYPWAAAYSEGTIAGSDFGFIVFAEVLLFLATVAVGYVYAWRQGVFRWR